MTSPFDDLFQSGVETLMEYSGDRNTITYVDKDGNQSGPITALLGHVEVSEVEASDGTIRKEYRLTIHITRDSSGKWAGYWTRRFAASFLSKGKPGR